MTAKAPNPRTIAALMARPVRISVSVATSVIPLEGEEETSSRTFLSFDTTEAASRSSVTELIMIRRRFLVWEEKGGKEMWGFEKGRRVQIEEATDMAMREFKERFCLFGAKLIKGLVGFLFDSTEKEGSS